MFLIMTPTAIATIVVMALSALYFFIFRERDSYKGKTLPPYCPSGYIESIRQITSSNVPWFLLDMAHKVGFVYRIRLPGSGAIVVAEPHLARQILKDPKCQGKPSLICKTGSMITKGPNIGSADGYEWSHRRKGVSPSFSSSHIKRMNRICEEHVEKWIEARHSAVNNNDPFDVSEEMIRLTIRVICESAFEYDITSSEIDSFLHEIELSLREFIVKKDLLGIRALVGPYLIEEHRRACEASDRLQQFALKMIKAHRENPNASSETVLARIINNPNYKDDFDRASDVLVMLLAGHDTTGYTLAWLFLELAKNPEEMIKLRNDLIRCGPDNWKQSRQLKNVIQESMRLDPVGAFITMRVTGRDIVFGENNEYIIPKDTIAFFPLLLLHRNPNIYENPDQFIPSRWENMSEMGSNALIPFSLGSRNCVGQALANAELYSTVARVALSFDLEVVEEGKPDYFMSMKPKGTILRAKPVTST